MRRRAFRLAKERDRPSEDALAVCRRANRYALSDGAGACYDGRSWARILCRNYIRDPTVCPDWLDAARQRLHAIASPPPEDWLGVIAFQKGSFATLLGFTIFPDRIAGLALGDTVLFVEREGQIDTFPQMSAEDFHLNPVLLSSHRETGAFPDTDEAFGASRFTMPAPDSGWAGTRLLAMTDALAAWVLAEPQVAAGRLGCLREIASHDGFAALVGGEITAGRMRRDDATLLVLEP
jgi:hypothetical protein